METLFRYCTIRIISRNIEMLFVKRSHLLRGDVEFASETFQRKFYMDAIFAELSTALSVWIPRRHVCFKKKYLLSAQIDVCITTHKMREKTVIYSVRNVTNSSGGEMASRSSVRHVNWGFESLEVFKLRCLYALVSLTLSSWTL